MTNRRDKRRIRELKKVLIEVKPHIPYTFKYLHERVKQVLEI